MNADELQKRVEEQVLDSYEAMYRLAYTYVRNEEDALDIVQESVYKAIKYSGRVRQEAHIRTWLWRIVMNTAVDFIRKNSREIATDETRETGKEDVAVQIEKAIENFDKGNLYLSLALSLVK